jgi:hypothetical protein
VKWLTSVFLASGMGRWLLSKAYRTDHQRLGFSQMLIRLGNELVSTAGTAEEILDAAVAQRERCDRGNPQSHQ